MPSHVCVRARGACVGLRVPCPIPLSRGMGLVTLTRAGDHWVTVFYIYLYI